MHYYAFFPRDLSISYYIPLQLFNCIWQTDIMWTPDIARVSSDSFSSRATNYPHFMRYWHLESNLITYAVHRRTVYRGPIVYPETESHLLCHTFTFSLLFRIHIWNLNTNSLPIGLGTSVFGLHSLLVSESFCSSWVTLSFNLLLWRPALSLSLLRPLITSKCQSIEARCSISCLIIRNFE